MPIYKSIVLDFIDQYGLHLEVIKPEKGITKIASEISDECLKYLSTIPKDPDAVYALTTALGASEYYSSNKNHDAVFEAELIGSGDEYGYNTFKTAHVFQDHMNKDPKYKIGDVIKVFYNPRMHRVELLIAVYKSRSPEIVNNLETFADTKELCGVSFGLSCPSECCSVCGNINHTREQRCDHLKYEGGRIYTDGTKVMAITYKPKFYDISFVWNRANYEALVMKKLASVDPPEEKFKIYIPDTPTKKQFYTDISNRVISKLAAIEPTLTHEEINKLAQYKLASILASLTSIGIILKPEEFKELITLKQAEAKDINKFSHIDIDENITDLMMDRLTDRSFYRPFILNRVMSNQSELKKTAALEKTPAEIGNALYALYRNKITGMVAGAKSILPKLALLIALGMGIHYYRKTKTEIPDIGEYPFFLDKSTINPVSNADLHAMAMSGTYLPSQPVRFNERYRAMVDGIPASYILSAFRQGIDISDKNIETLTNKQASVYSSADDALIDTKIIEYIY
jgi:hypothetical protein